MDNINKLLEQNESSISELVTIGAIGWLQSHLWCFNPFANGQQADEFAQTALAELTVLCYQVKRRPELMGNSRISSLMNSCLKLIEDVYRITDFHEYIFRGNKYAFIAHLIIWLTLVEQKSEEIVSRKQLQWLIDSGNVTVIERIPFRSLELRYFLDFGNFSHHLPSEQELFKQTILGDKFELISLTDADIYSITHTIFYLTDFGFKHSHLLESSHNSILEILQNLIGIMLSAKHWDLVAELILAYRCLTTKENFWITLAWKALYSVQTSLGMIYKDNQQDTLETTNLSSKLFRGYYHRTLVTVMASLLGKIK